MTKKKQPDESGYLKIDTYRDGPFVFQIGVDLAFISNLIARVNDAYARFYSAPLIDELADELEKISLVSAVYSTNTIEGANLSEKETEEIIQLSADQIQNNQQKRVYNLEAAYSHVNKQIAAQYKNNQLSSHLLFPDSSFFTLSEQVCRELHRIVCEGLTDSPDNIPGQYRREIKGFPIYVSDEAHGGRYKPPQAEDDVITLMQALVTWANSPAVTALPALIRAPLIHYYFERIHPFKDGNGRVGRLLETFLLETAGYKYIAKAMTNSYLKNIDKYYALFNQCRKAAEKHEENPNTPFVLFFLEGMLNTINHLQDNAHKFIAHFIDNYYITNLKNQKKINARQHAILTQLSRNEDLCHKQLLASQPWYKALYEKLGERTKSRDLKELVELHVIFIEENGKINLSKLKPKLQLTNNPLTSLTRNSGNILTECLKKLPNK